MNNYEKYELQKHSSMKNQSYLFDKLNFDSDIIISRLKNKNSPPMKIGLQLLLFYLMVKIIYI